MSEKKETLLYVGGVDWDFLRQRPQQLAIGLSKFRNIIYFQYKTLRNLNIFFNNLLKSDYKKIDSNLSVLKLFGIIPKMRSNLVLNELTCIIIAKFIKKYFRKNNLILTTVIIGNPYFAKLIKYLDVEISIYDCVDDHSAFSGANIATVESLEGYLTSHANLIIVSSNLLYKRFKEKKVNVKLISNGVNHKDFYKISHFNDNRIKRIKSKSKIICGFIGAVYDWIDVDLIEYTVSSLPEHEFVIVGPVKTDINNLLNYSNIVFLGEVEYDMVPYYIKSFDICMLPFKINRLTENANPIKIYEYFSLGKPVISTHLSELDKYSEYLYIAEDNHDFVEGIKHLVSTKDNPKMIQKRISLAENNSWSSKAEKINELIKIQLNRF